MTTAPLRRSWLITVIRAIAAAALALVITFNADHSSTLGFYALAGFALISGIVVLVGALRAALPRPTFLWFGIAALVGAVAALVLRDAGIATLLFVGSAFFAVTGIIELVTGLRARGANPAARDWIFVGALGCALALALLLIPADFSQSFEVSGAPVPPLTASVIAVGLLGAYGAIAAVYLAIAGLSLKWETNPMPVKSES